MSKKRSASPIFVDHDLSGVPKKVAAIRRKKLIAFGWYGGKFSHLDWLLPLLPATRQYCEPFSGSGAVLINRPPSPVETYNDIDGDVVNFFRVLREQKIALVEAIALTPFSREELLESLCSHLDLSDLERARLFYVRARQTRTGLAQTSSLGRWANCKNASSHGMSNVVSRWVGGIESLSGIADRLMRVQIENRPAVEVVRLYDDPETLFYVDPPYPHESRTDSRAYGFEMSNEQHIELAESLRQCSGKVAVSGYVCDLMESLYGNWNRHDAPEKKCHSSKQARRESLWVNY